MRNGKGMRHLPKVSRCLCEGQGATRIQQLVLTTSPLPSPTSMMARVLMGHFIFPSQATTDFRSLAEMYEQTGEGTEGFI